MRSHELKKAKRDVRRRVLELRDAMGADERRREGAAIVARFVELPELASSSTVMAFWSFGSEVPTEPLIAALLERGIRVVLPAIVDGVLQVRTYESGAPVTATSFGAMEPAEGQVVPATDIDVVCTPAVAFDRSGRRIGYGGGYYDAFLSKTRRDTDRIGIAFGLQVLAEPLPSGNADLRVDTIVTGAETIRCERVR
jgi:5-formyltetrahydrofolate cyclo-ligase